MSEKQLLVTEKTSAGLCDALFAEFDLLRNGLSDPRTFNEPDQVYLAYMEKVCGVKHD